MTCVRPTIGILLAGASLMALVWWIAPLSSPPLYDGLGLPAEPYRYLKPPAGQPHGLPPSSAHVVLRAGHGGLPAGTASTLEAPPQAILLLQDNAVAVPSGASSVTLTIRPVLPPTPVPGTLDGNVYRFNVSAPGHPSLVVHRNGATVELRATDARVSPAVEQYTGHGWRKLSTAKLLNVSVFVATVSSLGDFALVLKGPASTSGSGSPLLLIIAGVIVLLLAAGALLLIRVSRGRSANAVP